MPILRDCPLSPLEGLVVVNALFFGGDWEYWIFGGPVLGVWIEAERDVRLLGICFSGGALEGAVEGVGEG